MNPSIPSFSPSRESSIKSFRNDKEDSRRNIIKDFMPEGSLGPFWDDLYASLLANHQALTHKMALAQQSMQLHQQALTLKNQEAIQIQNNIISTSKKINARNSEIGSHDGKMRAIGEKCAVLKAESDAVRARVNKELAIVIQQEKHREQIRQKTAKLEDEILGLEKELAIRREKQNVYYDVIEENDKLRAEQELREKEYSLAQLKIEKEQHDEDKLNRKMNELEKIIAAKEEKNRQLGKKLFQLKKMRSPSSREANPITLEQLNGTVEGIEAEYSRLQQQLLNLTDSIQEVHHKTKIKQNEVDQLKKKRERLEEESKGNPSFLGSRNSPDKKPKSHYHVIESQEDDLVLLNRIQPPYSEEGKDDQSNRSKKPSSNNSNYEMSPSVKNLISRYHNIINQ